MYKVDFGSLEDDLAKKRYMLCYEAVVGQREPAAMDKWDTILDLIKKLKGIGNETEKILTNSGKIQLFELDMEGEKVIYLEKAEHKQLVTFFKMPIWPVHALEDVMPCRDWLEAMKNDGGSLAKDAKPQAKRIAEGAIAGAIPSKTEESSEERAE